MSIYATKPNPVPAPKKNRYPNLPNRPKPSRVEYSVEDKEFVEEVHQKGHKPPSVFFSGEINKQQPYARSRGSL